MRFFLLFAVLFFALSVVFAQDATLAPDPDWVPVDPIFVPPEWFESFLLMLKSLPTIGPVIVKASQWFGVLVTVTTSLTVAVISLVNGAAAIANKLGKPEISKKIEEKAAKIIYWLKYVSAFNAPKK